MHCLRTWSQTVVGVTIRGQDGVCGDELLPDQSETKAKTGTMASKTNFLRLIDMVREYKPGLLNNANHTSLTVADTELSE